MKRFLIPATTLLILLIAVFAIPNGPSKIHQGAGWIDQNGGTVNVTGSTKVIIPAGALDENTYITVTVEIYEAEEKIHYIFGPHGTVFNVPVEITMPWNYLRNYSGSLELWYLEDNGDVTLVGDAVPDENGKKYTLYVDHFSEYYFPRP